MMQIKIIISIFLLLLKLIIFGQTNNIDTIFNSKDLWGYKINDTVSYFSNPKSNKSGFSIFKNEKIINIDAQLPQNSIGYDWVINYLRHKAYKINDDYSIDSFTIFNNTKYSLNELQIKPYYDKNCHCNNSNKNLLYAFKNGMYIFFNLDNNTSFILDGKKKPIKQYSKNIVFGEYDEKINSLFEYDFNGNFIKETKIPLNKYYEIKSNGSLIIISSEDEIATKYNNNLQVNDLIAYNNLNSFKKYKAYKYLILDNGLLIQNKDKSWVHLTNEFKENKLPINPDAVLDLNFPFLNAYYNDGEDIFNILTYRNIFNKRFEEISFDISKELYLLKYKSNNDKYIFSVANKKFEILIDEFEVEQLKAINGDYLWFIRSGKIGIVDKMGKILFEFENNNYNEVKEIKINSVSCFTVKNENYTLVFDEKGKEFYKYNNDIIQNYKSNQVKIIYDYYPRSNIESIPFEVIL